MEQPAIPDTVAAALRQNPHCSLGISEALSFRNTNSGGVATTERSYFLHCPSKAAQLLERSTTQRDVAPGEGLPGLLPIFPSSGFGDAAGSRAGGWPLDALLPGIWPRGAPHSSISSSGGGSGGGISSGGGHGGYSSGGFAHSGPRAPPPPGPTPGAIQI